MLVWLMLGLGAAAVVASRGSAPQRAAAKPQRVDLPGDDDTPISEREQITGRRDVIVVDPWSCKKAKNQPMPDVAAYVPSRAIALGGPIALAIVGGIEVVRRLFQAIGPKRVCTVLGGQYVPLVVTRRRASGVWMLVDVAPHYGGAPAGAWIYMGTRTDTGPLPVDASRSGAEPAPRQQYLMFGGRPPPDLWPHVNIPRWQSSVPPALEVPAVDVVRDGDDLTVYVWLPPRAPRSHVTALGKYRVDHPVRWHVRWAIK